MAELFASGQIIWFVLALVLVEALVVMGYRYWSGSRGIEPVSFLANLVSGACLMLAVQAALTGARWEMTGLWMLAGLSCHVVDAALRWQK